MGDAEGLTVCEACLCNIEHFQGGPQGFPGLCTQHNRVNNEQKQDREKGQQDNSEQEDAPARIELLVIQGFHCLLSFGHGHEDGHND